MRLHRRFKFDETEAGEKEVLKNMQRRQVELENGLISAEEAQQQEMDEQEARERYNVKLVNLEEEAGEGETVAASGGVRAAEEENELDEIFGEVKDGGRAGGAGA